MPYAFDEFRTLASRLPTPFSDRDPVCRYACALVAEIAYHHVPEFEINDKKRAKIVPCYAHSEIVENGTPTSIIEIVRKMEFDRSFVVVDRGIIAVGIVINGLLFIGFRGTMFLYDWKINLRASLTELNSSFRYDRRIMPATISGWGGGRVHQGFAEEAVRVSARIMDAMMEHQIQDINHILLSGHSLGGAVAALAANFFPRGSTSVCIFGAPRYCNVSAYYHCPDGPPTQIQRPGDFVPLIPPRGMGYADHPYQFDTSGQQIVGSIYSSGLAHSIWRAALFVGRRFEPHNMEAYRRELGQTANATLWHEALTPHAKLELSDIEAP